MGIGFDVDGRGIAEIVVERPPVNALDIASWLEIAQLLDRIAASVRVVVLRAEGRGFNAGVDLKELQSARGHEALLAVNKACAAAFRAVYECPVPVVAAVQGYCLGGGVGLVGSADVVLASDDATFGLPEVERGALGAATHLARLVPPAMARAMLLTGARATAAQLHGWGSVLRVTSREQLRAAALEVAATIASRRPAVIRAAKECLNGLDAVDPRRSYRFEQGFTYELTLGGDGDAARDAFVDRERR